MSPHIERDNTLLAWLHGHRRADGERPEGDRRADGERPEGPTTPVRRPARVFTGAPPPSPQDTVRVTAAPARLPSEHEQAAHELALVTALVLNAPQASRALDLLVNSDRIHPEGAVVFASLLHLTGREEAAQFWWQFAAGSGNQTAAYCLHLYHLHLGETRDAAYWRAQAEFLAANPRPADRRGLHSGGPLLPDHVRRDILARCHQGLHPRLPASLEAVINRLVVDADDEDYGEIPQPSRALSGELGCARPS